MNEIVKKNGITYGVISGLVGIIATTLMYAIDLKLFTNIWLGIGLLVIWIIIGVLLLTKTKKEKNGVLTFKEGFTAYFISALIGIIIGTAFNIILFNFVDTEARDIINQNLIDFQVGMLEKYNAPSADIAKAVEEMEKNSQYSISGQLFGIAKSLVGSIVFGLILAAIFKSKTREVF